MVAHSFVPLPAEFIAIAAWSSASYSAHRYLDRAVQRHLRSRWRWLGRWLVEAILPAAYRRSTAEQRTRHRFC
jgi:hypothetical protein